MHHGLTICPPSTQGPSVLGTNRCQLALYVPDLFTAGLLESNYWGPSVVMRTEM